MSTVTDTFVAERPRLVALAYRMLGSWAEAEDVAQEAWLRWWSVDPAAVRSPEAWLTTVTTRLAIDHRRAQERRRERYVGPWLPEPISTGPDPAETVEQTESLAIGFMVMLDRLNPVERAVFLLADVFRQPSSVVADAVGKSPAACRQIATRARRRVRAEGPVPTPADAALVADLVSAVGRGDEARLLELLDPTVQLLSDGGPTKRAARRPVVGPRRVARLLINLSKRMGERNFGLVSVSGGPALLVRYPDGSPDFVFQIDQRDGRACRVWIVSNPDKLESIERPAS